VFPAGVLPQILGPPLQLEAGCVVVLTSTRRQETPVTPALRQMGRQVFGWAVAAAVTLPSLGQTQAKLV
jgi:hypothetical protein